MVANDILTMLYACQCAITHEITSIIRIQTNTNRVENNDYQFSEIMKYIICTYIFQTKKRDFGLCTSLYIYIVRQFSI